MRRGAFFGVAVLVGICALGVSTPGAGAAAPADPLEGTWTLVRVDNLMPDGSRIELYGPSPQGLLIFDGHGRYSLQILRAGRPKFAANDKSKGTPEENAAAVMGSNSHFGRYRVDVSKLTIAFVIDHASFPNWEGTKQVRTFELRGDHLIYRVPQPTSGKGAVGEVEWKRADAP